MDHKSLTDKYEKGKQIICFTAIIISTLGFTFDLITFLSIYSKPQLLIQIIGLLLCFASLIMALIIKNQYRLYFGVAVYAVVINIFITHIASGIHIAEIMPNQTNIFTRDVLFIVAYMALSGFMIGPKHLIIQCCFLILLIAYYTFFLKDPFVIENAAIYLLSTIGFTAVMHFVIKTIYKFIANLEILTDKYNALQQEAVNKNTFLEIAYNEINSQKEEIIAQKDELSAQHNLVSLQKEKIENIHQNLSDSINYAKQIQDAMLPTKAVTDLLLKNYFIFFNPKDIVSGDFYWIHKFKNYLVVAVADCTGHGVPGAFMSMLGISFLNEIVKKNEIISPSKILDHLRDSIIDALKQRQSTFDQNDGMDIAICIINTDTLELNYAGANNPCWIVNSQQSSVDSQQSLVNSQQSALANSEQLTDNSFLIELKPDKQPIGIHTNMQPFTNNSFQLQKGDVMYLMSDGYADQFGGPEHKKFQTKKFKTLLLTNSQLPMPDQKQTLETTINEWIGNYEQTDDITILGIKF